jgi:hypothetical protein
VHDAGGVRSAQRGRDLDGDVEGFTKRDMTISEALPQRFARDVLHRDELLAVSRHAEPVDRADVGMIEGGGGPRLLFEPRQARFVLRDVRAQHLERNHPVERQIAREPDLAHATASKGSDHVIVLDAGPRTDRHVGLDDYFRRFSTRRPVRSRLIGRTRRWSALAAVCHFHVPGARARSLR